MRQGGGVFEIGDHFGEPRGEFFGGDGFCVDSLGPEGEGEGGEVLGVDEDEALRCRFFECGLEAGHFELAFEDFALGLCQEEIVGVVLAEDVVEERSGGLEISFGAFGAWEIVDDEPGDA